MYNRFPMLISVFLVLIVATPLFHTEEHGANGMKLRWAYTPRLHLEN